MTDTKPKDLTDLERVAKQAEKKAMDATRIREEAENIVEEIKGRKGVAIANALTTAKDKGNPSEEIERVVSDELDEAVEAEKVKEAEVRVAEAAAKDANAQTDLARAAKFAIKAKITAEAAPSTVAEKLDATSNIILDSAQTRASDTEKERAQAEFAAQTKKKDDKTDDS